MLNFQEIKRDELFNLSNEYIYHGSPILVGVLKPHKAKCGTNLCQNNLMAVYGTNNIEFALLFSFEKLPKNDFSWSASFESGKHCAKLFNSTYIDENACGYIYALDKKYFTNTESIGGIQYICKHSLKPKQIYKVYYKDFKDYFKNINK